jgi:hypothetical protein
VSTQLSTFAPEVTALRPTRPLPFRLIPRIETYPAVVAFAQTLPGKVILLAVFGLLLSPLQRTALPLVLCLALMTFMPHHRHALVAISTIVFSMVVTWPQLHHPVAAVTIITLILLGTMVLTASAAAWPRSWFGSHPTAWLLGGFTAWTFVASFWPHSARSYWLVWDFSRILGTYLWFIAYAVTDRQNPANEFSLRVGSLNPFWGSSNTPLPSGSAYLKTVEARDAQQLAVVQLKGLKLLAWAALILVFLQAWTRVFHGYLGIPSFQQSLAMNVQRTPLPWFVCWASLIVHFFENIMEVAILGHRIIACCRMAGFDALRNTYRPLSSRTVAEFFNRYYYYYKELLVTFFFFPTFFAQSPRFPRLRLAVGIFAAAGAGNAFYHFMRDLGYIQGYGFWPALKSFQVFMFYCLVLATAIIVSRLRQHNATPSSAGFFRGTLCPAFSVCLFYCLLSVFMATDRAYPLSEHLRFLGHLFLLT